MSLTAAPPRALPAVAAHVDAELARIDSRIDWLLALSPLHVDALWDAFEASGRREVPPLQYAPVDPGLRELRGQLHALPLDDIESPLLSGLLAEKQRELERQIELVELNGTDGFIHASIELFGTVEPALARLAEDVLAQVPAQAGLVADTGIDEVLAAVEAEVAWYREQSPDFDIRIVGDDELDSLMMVSHGTFYVDCDIRIPRARLQPLIQHEIGTHVLTRHNGRRQPLRQLEVGLAHYDPLQEGLGVLAEYLAGYLPGARLRVLAARVVACQMAIHGEQVPAIFERLHGSHGLPTEDAFDVAVRARRGGGLTKDAVYLGGLRDLLDYLREGGDFESLFIGKFALSQQVVLQQLMDEGWLRGPELLPRHVGGDGAAERLARCRRLDVIEFFHQEPQA